MTRSPFAAKRLQRGDLLRHLRGGVQRERPLLRLLVQRHLVGRVPAVLLRRADDEHERIAASRAPALGQLGEEPDGADGVHLVRVRRIALRVGNVADGGQMQHDVGTRALDGRRDLLARR